MSDFKIKFDKKQLKALKKKTNPDIFERIIDKAVKSAADTLEANILEKMDEMKIHDTGRAGQSLGPVRKLANAKYYLGFGVEYIKYVEFGSRPHRPPFTPIFEWVKRKLGYSGDEAKQIAGAIWNKITQKGTKGKHFVQAAIDKGEYQEAFDKTIQKWLEEVEK